jgi:hypothetical protein
MENFISIFLKGMTTLNLVVPIGLNFLGGLSKYLKVAILRFQLLFTLFDGKSFFLILELFDHPNMNPEHIRQFS